MSQHQLVGRLKEGFHDYGRVVCDECNMVIDLSEAVDFQEATEIWNGHIREEHD